LQLYDLRREARLRQARDWFNKSFFVEKPEDFLKVAGPGTEGGTSVGMVFGYWEQACAMLNYGLLHEDLFFETSGEFYQVWERLRGIAPQLRQQWVYKGLFANLEQAALRYEKWVEARSPGHLAAMREFMKQMRSQPAKAA
jgi:hypothetical protein